LENKLPTSDVQQINNDVNRYHAQAEQYYRRQLEEALKQSPVDKLISSLKQQQKK
jgi:hypothetical protein